MNHTGIRSEPHGSALDCSSLRHTAALHMTEHPECEAVAGVPLIRPGTGPLVPRHVAAAGAPRGANWKTVSGVEPCEERWAEVKRVCDGCFNDGERGRGVQVIDHRAAYGTARLVFDHFEELIGRHSGRLAFGGCLVTRHPWRASTATVAGGHLLRYSAAHELREAVAVGGGWAAGGTLDIAVPGHAHFTGGYTRGVGDVAAWPGFEIVHSTLTVEPGRRGRIDVHAAGGVYSGLLYLAMTGFPRHDEHGARCFDLGGHHVWTTCGYLCFPLKDAFVKSPGSPAALLRLRRTWADGDPEPAPSFPEGM
ncbi:hypothetical protein SAMN05444920_105228 [Nonomuraea solani]|uniref:Uncharacterized protein n=1 Tax=Nonomuraea solani TaxID=1144553 RepID=A0A1H6DFQ6_9ACTN|nr:hypothetical protein [Nonomuraea solani]SEG83583.1 hypothetical protein SAMN05444920_105228 [Nonomuraea solani]